MKLKRICWELQDGVHVSHVMGVTLAVHLDKDGTYTACLSGMPNRRPEIQKSFSSSDKAKQYAIDVLLRRELDRYFIIESTPPARPKGVYRRVWKDFYMGVLPNRYLMKVPVSDVGLGKQLASIQYLESLGYKQTSVQQDLFNFVYSYAFEL